MYVCKYGYLHEGKFPTSRGRASGRMLRQRVADRLSRGRTGSGVPPNPSTYVTARASSSEEEEEKEGKGKPWQHVSKEVYEEQLEKLQEQLINTMVENQALQGEPECVSAVAVFLMDILYRPVFKGDSY